MKKFVILSLLALSVSSLAGCFDNKEKKEEICEYHIDLDGDGLCENCGKPVNPDPDPDPPGPAPDPTTVVRIKASGKMTKQTYGLNDSWDLNGYSVYAVTQSGVETKLAASEYTVKFDPLKPSQYVSNLNVLFTYLKNTSFQAMLSETDIAVAAPTYNEESEKNAYYADANLTLSGESLRSELNRHTFTKHTTWITYRNVNDYKYKTSAHESTDLIPNKSKMELSYTGKQVAYSVGSREHVWPAANSSNLWTHDQLDYESTYIGGGSDLYHVRPVDKEINDRRGNSLFIDFDDVSYRADDTIADGGPYIVKGYGNTRFGQFEYVEVDDHMKGDIARIIAYVYMHYKRASGTPSGMSSKTSSSLNLTNVLGYSSESKCKQKLIEWNNLDPVSEVEKYRNHTVQLIQGNRNPFVDYPELMAKAFN